MLWTGSDIIKKNPLSPLSSRIRITVSSRPTVVRLDRNNVHTCSVPLGTSASWSLFHGTVVLLWHAGLEAIDRVAYACVLWSSVAVASCSSYGGQYLLWAWLYGLKSRGASGSPRATYGPIPLVTWAPAKVFVNLLLVEKSYKLVYFLYSEGFGKESWILSRLLLYVQMPHIMLTSKLCR
jgi:hypothetical protein